MKKIIFLFLFFLQAYIMRAQMVGTYTVGGTNPDFATVDIAVDSILAQGIQGPVNISIRPGIYYVFITFPSLNYNYQITFSSESGNADDVQMTMSNLYECRNLVFKKVTIIPRVNTNYMYNYKGLEIAGSSFIYIDSCIIRGTSSTDERIGFTVAADFGDIYITNDSFRNLDYGVVYSDNTYYYGSDTHYGTHLVQGCDFDTVTCAMRISGQFGNSFDDSLLITGCQVRNGQSGIIIDGIADDVNGVNIKKNNINVSGASVNIQSNALTSTWRMPLFTNNMMIAPTAINMQNSAYLGFYNNSMYGTINIWFSSTNLWMTNNVVVNDTIHSYLFSLSDKTTYHADHNDFYAPLASPMFYVLNGNPNSCNNLATFQQSTGEDQHSLNVPPYFISQTDLHSYSPDLKFHGLSIPEVWDDIDGEIRNTVPDIGADEYHSSSLPPHAFFDYDCGLGNYAIQFLDTSVRATSYLWNFGDLSTSTLEFPSHTWAGYGPYNVTLVVTNNFGVDTISDSVHFVQNIPTVALNGNLLTATGGPYTAYQWNFNGTPINTATSSSYTAPFPGLYSVSVWEAGSTCPYTTSDIDVGIEEQNTTDFSLFPNPFDQSTTLFFPSSISGDENEIVLTDLQGRIVRTEKVSRADTFTLQRGNLEAGIYFCTVKSDGKNVGVKKIVVR